MFTHENGIILRKLERSDLPILMEIKNESWQNTHQITILNTEDQNMWFDCITSSSSPNCPENLILMAEIEEIVGVFKIQNIDWYSRRANVGWDLLLEHRGKGLGKKLVQAGVDYCKFVLNIHRLKADILANNERSIRCAENAGFKREGTEKEAILKTGRYLDSHIYGIILD